MSSLPLDHRIKPLPPLTDKLPPLPPEESSVDSPAPPSKSLSPSSDHVDFYKDQQSLNIPSGLRTPLTPTTPTTPSSPDSKPKKANPLVDLIETEKIYVDQMTGIIRKVASAWSRSNLPPPELDAMFRSIESVYKANRGLYTKLKEIGINPSSPKALGDLLMRWIDDLETPYTNYATKYCCGFDAWNPVQCNPRLANTLSAFSEANPPPVSANDSRMWTLDSLFLLPRARLKYYRKLYSRLLKSTAPGRSDHKLLVRALDTLDKLLDTLESRSQIAVDCAAALNSDVLDSTDEVVIDMRPRQDAVPPPTLGGEVAVFKDESQNSSARDSKTSSGVRLSAETANTSISRLSNSSPILTLSDLERRLLTDKTLDIFTMKPKAVKLQLASVNLTFTREIRLSIDVTISFTPRATGVEVIHRRAHIIILSDLFLVCERMSAEEKANQPHDADMWLCYPPLAGKVLRLSELPDKGNAVQIAIMRKEFLVIDAGSSDLCELMISRFKECIDFSGSLPPPSKQPPPPVPPISGAFREQVTSAFQPNNTSALNDGKSPLVNNLESSSNSSSSQLRSQIPPQAPQAYQTGDVGNVSMQQVVSIQSSQGTNIPSHGFSHIQQSSSIRDQAIPPSRSTSLTGAGVSGYPPIGMPMPSAIPMMASTGQPSGLPTSQNSLPGSPYSTVHNALPGAPYHGQSPFPISSRNPQNFPSGPVSSRPSSQSSSTQSGIRKSPSSRSLTSQYSQQEPLPAPPLPAFATIPRSNSFGSLHAPQARPLLPSAAFNTRSVSLAEPSFDAPSPPESPVYETPEVTGPVTSTVSAQMKCKVFLKQQHAQWKSLGSARLKLYREDPTNVKQLVVEADNKDKSILISTIVLTDGVERVGKTGVAIELSDKGARTGVVYMIQLRNEKSAGGLFDSLLAGSDRAGK
ncbi:hypothetical protein BDQ17DRAFT_1340752 [Cyathus striatus]|nr:hypothetical protein BDQ17DRAFT_1340752 [Cyathus striatus]